MPYYRIQSWNGTGRYLNVKTNTTITGRTDVNLYMNTPKNDQEWQIESLGNRQQVRTMNNPLYMLNAHRTDWNCDVYLDNEDTKINFISQGNNIYLLQLDSEPSRYLTATGTAVGANVNWQLRNTADDSQKWKLIEGELESEPPTSSDAIQTFINNAKACVGMNLAECAAHFGVANPNVAWCAWFVIQCAKGTGLDVGTSLLASGLHGVYGNYSLSGGSLPKAGDLAFIEPDGYSGIGHVGIIVDVTSTQIITVEGNMSGHGNPQAAIVKNGYYTHSGTSQGFGKILQYGKNS